jgi:DNA-binding transcriptional ArsR family regulator
MSYFPTSPDDPDTERFNLQVLEFGTESAGEAFQTLSSQTAQDIISVLQDGPATTTEVVDDVDTSLQNVHYHLDQLVDAGVVEVVDTVYSKRGRQMDVYATAGSPLLIVAGDEDDRETVVDLLSEFMGSIGLLAGVSIAVQRLVGSNVLASSRAYAGGSVELFPVGLLVFLLGLMGLVSVFVVLAWRKEMVSPSFGGFSIGNRLIQYFG